VAEFDSAIPPGGTGRVVARVETKGFIGPRTKTVTVRTNDPARPQFTLSLKFDSRPAIELLPRRMIRLTTTEGRPATAYLLLRRGDGQPLELGRMTSSVESIRITSVELSDVIEDESVVAQLGTAPREGDGLLRVDLEDVDRPFRGRADLSIATNHPRTPEVVVPVSIEIRELIASHPRRAQLSIGSGPEHASAWVSLRHSSGRAFEITDIRLEGDLPGVTASREGNGPAAVHQIELVAESGETAPGIYRGELVASTTARRAKEVRVPVVLRVPRPSAGGPRD
jgi:hypothetical protein